MITSLDITPKGYGGIAMAPETAAPMYSGSALDTDRAGLAAWAAT